MRVVPIIRSFNSGEVTPLFYGRTDQDKYHSACKILQNMIPTVQGPATRRGGTRYVGGAKSGSARAWLAPFRFSLTQNYILEFGNNYIRFWVNRGQLLSGGTPYEIASPWSTADLVTAAGTFALRFDQSGDVLWIANANGTFPVYKLSRLGATNWTLAPETFNDGPFQGVDLQSTTTVQVSAATGSVTITASAAIFKPGDVGTPFYVESQNPAIAVAWGSSSVFSAGTYCSNNGNVYYTSAGGTTGSTPPTHVSGSANDGSVTWQYVHSGYGVIQITGYTSPTQVTGTVLTSWKTAAQPTALPLDVTAAGLYGVSNTKRWSLSLFSSDRGWPVDVKFFRSRLCYIGSNWFVASQSGVYNSFALRDGPDALATCAILEQLPVENLSWLAPSTALLVGTPSGERSLQEQASTKVFQADNIKEQPETKYGATAIETVALAQVVLFVQRTRQRLREMQYDYVKNKYVGEDLTVIAEHMFSSGMVQLAWAQEPDCLLWSVLGDGSVAVLTYNRDRGVVAWSRHYIAGGGIVESAASIPSPDGSKDDVWLIVRRTINGNTVRYIEVVEDRQLYKTGLANAFYVDCGITYSGAPTKVITGLSHLEGATVKVLADGSPTVDCVVQGGTITLPRACSVAQIGFHSPAIVQPLEIDAGAQDGTSQSRMKAVAQLYVRLVDTIGGKAGPNLNNLYNLDGIDLTQPVGVAPGLFNGDQQVVFEEGFPSTDGAVIIVQDQPLPMTVVALMPRMQVND